MCGLTISGDRCVLVTGDDRAVRVLIGDVLRRRGYQVLVTENTQHAVRQAETHGGAIDLLIAAGSDGPALAEALLDGRPAMPVLWVLEPGEERPEPHGGRSEDWLAKPFSPETLAGKVRALLST